MSRGPDALERMFHENDHTAAHNRADFDAAGVTVLNLVSSLGAGKTALLRRTLEALRDTVRIGIVEGAFYVDLKAVDPGATVIETSVRTGLGVDAWCRRLTTR